HHEARRVPSHRLDDNLVSRLQLLKEAEVGVAVAGDDRDSLRTGYGRTRDEAGAEGHRTAGGAGEHDEIDTVARDAHPAHRPCVRPRPRLHPRLARERPSPRATEQILSERGLGVDRDAVAELPQPDGQERGDRGAVERSTKHAHHDASPANRRHATRTAAARSRLTPTTM